MEDIVITTTREETIRYGEAFAQHLAAGDVVRLNGELGAGKTTFMQGVAKGLGIKRRVISPTFMLARMYGTNHPDIKRLYHIDLYRTQTVQDMKGFGITEMLHDTEGVVAIEWSEKLTDLKPSHAWNILLEHITEGERKITITEQ